MLAVETQPGMELTQTEKTLMEMVTQSTGEPASTTATWTQLGIDSLSMAELVMEVEDHFQVRLDERVFKVDNIAQMAAYLDSQRTGS